MPTQHSGGTSGDASGGSGDPGDGGVAEDVDEFDDAAERAVGLLVIVAAVVSLVTGLALAFVYRPDEFGWLRMAHSGSSAIALISAVAARVVRRRGRIKVSGRGALGVIALILLIGAAFATGSQIAWRGGQPDDVGMFLDSGRRVVVNDLEMKAGDLVVAFLLHTLLGVCSFILLGHRYVRRWLRFRRAT